MLFFFALNTFVDLLPHPYDHSKLCFWGSFFKKSKQFMEILKGQQS